MQKFSKIWLYLLGIWLLSNFSDRLWLSLDNSVPGWDQSNHLTGSLNYLQALQKIELFNGSWWLDFWRLSSKYPPLSYIASAPFQQIFSKGNDQALAVNFLSSAILIPAVYLLANVFFNKRVAILATFFSVVFPRLYLQRLFYLTDNLLLALTIAAFTSLTFWKIEKQNKQSQWLYALIFGVFWGLALLAKQSVMFFLIGPLVWVIVEFSYHRQWLRLIQILVSFIVSCLIWWPWYGANWIYSFGTYSSSVTSPAALQGNAPINTLASWIYYWQDLPAAISWPLLLVPLVGLILNWSGFFPNKDKPRFKGGLLWLAFYCLAGYLICTLNINKNERYIMPYLPVLAIFLAYGLVQWRGKWQKVQLGTIALALLLMLGNLYQIALLSQISQIFSPNAINYPYRGQTWPLSEVIETITKTTPNLQATLGVIPNTAEINHNTLNYYGALADFQVYGRELGSKTEQVKQDGQSLDWFIAKTGDNAFARKAQLDLADQLARDTNFNLIKNWTLPDKSNLKLYHRKNPLVSVTSGSSSKQVELLEVIVPESAPANVPVPVTYHWAGAKSDLKNGLVLISWQNNKGEVGWINDHAVGMGELYGSGDESLEVIEKTAMLPSDVLGDYHPVITYINPKTKFTRKINSPSSVNLKISSSAASIDSPVLDRVSQLRLLSLSLQEGIKGLDRVFLQVARLNQYDPRQDYLEQAAQTLSYRLDNEKLNPTQTVQYLYGILLARVLQQDADKAIPVLQKLITLQRDNPYLHAYLAVVNLYKWDSAAAEAALRTIAGSQVREIRLLQGVTDILRGHIFQGINILKSIPKPKN